MAHTLILGGGFGGIAAANALRQLLPAEHRVTVVDQTARFHVGAGGTWIMLSERTYEEISQERTVLLEPGVEAVRAEVRQIDVLGRTVTTSGGTHDWDYLVLALGADVRTDAVPGLAVAHTFYTVAGAEKLRPLVADLQSGEIVLLIPKAPFKCPPAPYEAAMLLHDFMVKRGRGGSVRISIHTVEGTPMATAGPEMGAFIREELKQRGIGFFPQRTLRRVDEAGRKVEFADGTTAPFDLLICVPPHEAPAVVRSAGLLNPAGWVPVDPQSLQVKSVEGGRVFAIGDVTTVPLPGRFKPDMPLMLPKAGVMAAAQGETAAARIAAIVRRETATASFAGKGFCYLETGDAKAIRAEGSFFALPHPVMSKEPASAAQLADKHAWVQRHLQPRRKG